MEKFSMLNETFAPSGVKDAQRRPFSTNQA